MVCFAVRGESVRVRARERVESLSHGFDRSLRESKRGGEITATEEGEEECRQELRL